MFSWWKHSFQPPKQPEEPPAEQSAKQPFQTSLADNMATLDTAFEGSKDLVKKIYQVGAHRVAIACIDNLYNKELLARSIIGRLLDAQDLPQLPDELVDYLRTQVAEPIDVSIVSDWDTGLFMLMSGFALLFIDGSARILAFGIQEFKIRGVSEPDNEVMERGSREGFCEVLRINLSLVRRRIKNPILMFETMRIGKESNTEVALCYLRGQVAAPVLDKLRKKLQSIRMDVVLESGYIQPFLEDKPKSLVSTVGVTERPDTLCAKISEGRVGILVDGTPFALIVPYLFSENFQSMDDYCNRPYFATFIRLLKFLSFLIAVLFPGIYVALGQFNPEAFPSAILYRIVDAQLTTPFSLMVEAIVIHVIFEILREAGLRLPRPVGHAISIVGALVIGESAVSAGLIGSPMVMVVAITTVSSFVVPSLYNPAALLRFVFILAGGLTGIYGVMLLAAMLLVGLCSLDSFGIPYMSPIAPFDKKAMRDTFWRASWRRLARHTVLIQNMRGSTVGQRRDHGEDRI